MKRYPEYKESSVKWIGEIPRYWEIKRLKYIADLNMGQSPPSEEYNSDQVGTPFLQGNAEFGSHHPTPKIYCPTAKKNTRTSAIFCYQSAPLSGQSTPQIKNTGLVVVYVQYVPERINLNAVMLNICLRLSVLSYMSLQPAALTEAVTVDEVSNLTCVVPSFF